MARPDRLNLRLNACDGDQVLQSPHPDPEVHLRDLKDEAESQQDAPEPLYKSPNADNVIPPELRTGLER